MKINKTKTLITVGLLSSTLSSVALPPASTPGTWSGCTCDSPVVLAGYDFQNMTGTVSSVAASSTASGITATNISGPGNVNINAFGAPGNNFGCFDGFDSGGAAGTIGFSITNNSAQAYCLNDVTFDFFTEGSGTHGPKKFFVRIGDGTNFWESAFVNSGSSTSVGSFSMTNQSGNQFGSDTDFYAFLTGETYTVEIVADGANSGSGVGLDLDNVNVHACPVPEPSSSLLVLAGSAFLVIRRKR